MNETKNARNKELYKLVEGEKVLVFPRTKSKFVVCRARETAFCPRKKKSPSAGKLQLFSSNVAVDIISR